MKKTIIKVSVFLLTFVISVLVISSVMNKGHNNLTMEMTPATFPVITMEWEGIEYNQLHGYNEPMDTAFQRDAVTVLGESRNTNFVIETYGREVTGVSVQVRSMDGSRLIEDTTITNYYYDNGMIYGSVALKDLIEKDTDYCMALVLELDGEQNIYYYTRVIWSDSLNVTEKLSFVQDFHERTFDKTAAKEITKYLETDSKLEDNSSFHKVNIHSSFKQITWGDMPVKEVGEPVIQLTEVASQTASVLVSYYVSTSDDENVTYYEVQEHYRLRYTTDRIYLLDYERTMTQIPNLKQMYANDKILLGITDENVSMVESADGNIVVFEEAGQLCSYNVTTNKLTSIFSFYDEQNMDTRTLYRQHAIKILDVDEGGNVKFAVYGYMNRGRHEGEVGIQIYSYDNALNTIEEAVYIPYNKNFSVLKVEMEQLLYLNRDQQLYLCLENTVYGIDLVEKTYSELVKITQDDCIQVSDNHRIIMWQDGEDIYHCNQLNIRNLNTDKQNVITVGEGEAIRPLGFMGEDVIYGVAKEEDIVEESSGRIFFPMYKVCISNSSGEVLKEYQQNDIYIESCSVVDNQITLERLQRNANGTYQEITEDHIMNNVEKVVGKNVVVVASTETYEKYVQIQTKVTIDSKTIKILTPKEVVFEGGRELELTAESEAPRYYVYGPYGVDAIYSAPGNAVSRAYDISGVVTNDSGECIWLKGNRVTRNQIMAIKGENVTEEKNSLAVCLDTVLKFEGIVRNSEQLIAQGQTVIEILEEIPDAQVLDLSGCTLDAILYYVNQDIPVLALLENGDAVLVTGFNEFNVVIMNPNASESLYKMGMNDATAWFAENGNHFITYSRAE